MSATAVDWSDPAPGRPIPLVAALRDDKNANFSVVFDWSK